MNESQILGRATEDSVRNPDGSQSCRVRLEPNGHHPQLAAKTITVNGTVYYSEASVIEESDAMLRNAIQWERQRIANGLRKMADMYQGARAECIVQAECIERGDY